MAFADEIKVNITVCGMAELYDLLVLVDKHEEELPPDLVEVVKKLVSTFRVEMGTHGTKIADMQIAMHGDPDLHMRDVPKLLGARRGR